MVREANNIVVLTGSGISAESGIKTFRDNNGLWENHRFEEVATPEAFERDPELVHRFYNQRRRQLLDGIEPNAAHIALTKFARGFSGSFVLVTQNVDNLHQRAGSNPVLAMHGELLKMRCVASGRVMECNGDITVEDRCSCCDKAGRLRPHIVWFGEMPMFMTEIEEALRKCDLFVAIGTSGMVYPAAGFHQLAKHYGARTVELNLESSASGAMFDEQQLGPASEVVPEFFS